LIKNLRQLKGYTAVRFLREFESKNWTRSGLDYLLAKIDRSGSIDRALAVVVPALLVQFGNVTVIEEMALSQEDKPRIHRTVRQIARESGIPRSSAHRIIKTDLQLKCLKKSNAQALTSYNKQARMTRARQLMQKYPKAMVNFIFFTDEMGSPLLLPPTHRTTGFRSVQVPERRTSTKTGCFERDRRLANQ